MRAALVLALAAISTVPTVVGPPSRAEEEPKIEFHTDGSKPEAEPEPPKEPPQEKDPRAPLEEVEGTFTACSAARMLELELSRRVSDIDPSRATGKRWTQYSTLQALRGRWEELIASDPDCVHDPDPELAERIMKLYRTVVEYPDLRRAAAIRAPLTVSTAAEASRLLDRRKDVPGHRLTGPVVEPRIADELERRVRLMTEALERLTSGEQAR